MREHALDELVASIRLVSVEVFVLRRVQNNQSLFNQRQDDAESLLKLFDHRVEAQVIHSKLPLDEIQFLHVHRRVVLLEALDLLAGLQVKHHLLQRVPNPLTKLGEALA